MNSQGSQKKKSIMGKLIKRVSGFSNMFKSNKSVFSANKLGSGGNSEEKKAQEEDDQDNGSKRKRDPNHISEKIEDEED